MTTATGFSLPTSGSPETVLACSGVSQVYWRRKGFFSPREAFYAVRDVNLALYAGQTIGIIGESGCGKSTLARIVSGLMPPTGGEVHLCGQPLYIDTDKHLLQEQRRNVQMVFQDPNSSLNPRLRVGESVGEPLRCLFPEMTATDREEATRGILAEVGIEPSHATRYPHEFSGGQRQRIAIARALVAQPRVVLCDEPTSSLDSSVQAQVLNLLDSLQRSYGVSYMFISHDLAVVRHMSDTVAVMYAGVVLEEGPVEAVFGAPAHPYTRLLLDSVPGSVKIGKEFAAKSGAREAGQREITLGEVSLVAAESATGFSCPFAGRCPEVREDCLQTMPQLVDVVTKTPCTVAANDAPDCQYLHRTRCTYNL